MEQPRYYWDPVIAPAAWPSTTGMFPVAGRPPDRALAGALVRLGLEGDTVVGEERLLTDAGRIRDVEIAPDGAMLR